MASKISGLLEKMMSADKDFRFMSTNDLMTELQTDSIKLDDEMKHRITKALLKLLDDKNGEVQNLAIKCLSLLIAKVNLDQITLVVKNLCQNIDSNQDRLRDVHLFALKAVVNQISLAQREKTEVIITELLPKLLKNLKEEKQGDSFIKIEIADILGIIVNKFGRQNERKFAAVQDVLFLLIKRNCQAIRKRAITILGYLVGIVQDDVYQRIVLRILECLQVEKDPNALRAYILAAETISSSSSFFTKHLGEFINLLISLCKNTEDDELKSSCAHAFQTFTSRCSKEVTQYLPAMIKICSEMIVDENESGEAMEVDGDEESEYSDDDDLSWKARQASAKFFQALISSKHDRLLEHYNEIAPILLGRFKESNENVKLDVFRAYEELLKQTYLLLPQSLSNLDSAFHNAIFNSEGSKEVQKLQRILAEQLDEYQRSVLQALSSQIPEIIQGVNEQLKSKSSAVRLQCFALLISLVKAYPGALKSDQFKSLIPAIKESLNKSADNSTKIETLKFLNFYFCCHESSTFSSHLATLIPFISACANDRSYETRCAAFTVLQSLIVILKSLPDTLSHVEEIWKAVTTRLYLNDIHQEHEIMTTGILLSTFGSNDHSEKMLTVLCARLQNEMTCKVTLQSLCMISSGNKVDLSPILDEVLQFAADFLQTGENALKVSTLTLLCSLVKNDPASKIPVSSLERVVREVPNLIKDKNNLISQQAIKFAKEVVIKFPVAIASSLNAVVDAFVKIDFSSLAGRSLEFAMKLFVAIMQISIPQKPDFTKLMSKLTNLIQSEKPTRQGFYSIAFIMAHAAKENNDEATTKALIEELIDSTKKEQTRIFSLYALGEIGRVSPEAFINDGPETIIMGFFNSSNEEVKIVASCALGALTAGNDSKYLPILLQKFKTHPTHQYLLLHALKEVIASRVEVKFSATQSDEIWAILSHQSKAKEESIRNVVAECMGKLCKIEPVKFLPKLIQISKQETPLELQTAVTAVRFMLHSNDDQYVHGQLGQLLSAINDEDLQVKKAAVMTINYVLKNKPGWVKELLPTLLPSLYRQTAIRRDLIREIEMGPFKHSVDDGLDLRKAAYECMYTFIDHCLEKIDIFEFLDYVERGLKDQHDIALLSLLMITRLANFSQMIQRIDGISDLIMPLLQLKARPNSVKQENDKLNELKRSAVNAVVSLHQVPDLQRSAKLTQVHEFIQSDNVLQLMVKDE